MVGLVAAALRKGGPQATWPGELGRRGRQPALLGREENGLPTLLVALIPQKWVGCFPAEGAESSPTRA